jgi:hypothetical protein
MNSLFGHGRRHSPDLLKLPALCIPAADEPEYLRSKREAQLQWMRDTGVQYLIDSPVGRAAKARPSKAAVSIRLMRAS